MTKEYTGFKDDFAAEHVDLVNRVPRAKIKEALESHGYDVYDLEPTDALQHTLLIDLKTGEISVSELE